MCFVSGDVVVAADWGKIVDCGGAAFRPGFCVVEVASGGWHATSRMPDGIRWENTGRIGGFGLAALAGGGSSSGGAVVDDLAVVVGDGVAPLAVGLFGCGLSGDVSNDRAVTTQFTGRLRQLSECLQVDVDVDDSAFPCSVGSQEEV